MIRLREAYDNLYKKHSQLLEQVARNNTVDVAKQSNISGEAIQKFVDEPPADPNVNIYGLAVDSQIRSKPPSIVISF